MSLPDRLYYPLDKAAKKLGCDVSDIIHLAAHGYISLCFKCVIDSMVESDFCLDIRPEVDEDALDNYVRDELDLETTEIYHGFSNSYLSYGGTFKLNVENGRLKNHQFILERYMGLIEIGQTDIYRNEKYFLNEDSVSIGWMWTPYDHNSAVIGFFEEKDDYGIEALPFVLGEFNNRLLISVLHEVSDCPKINIYDLVITHTELIRVNNPVVNTKDSVESPKTAALKGEIIRPLVQMLPSFNNVDLDSLPVSKIKDMIEASAAEKGIEFPEVYRSTWQKYLGRSRMIK